MVLNPDGTPTEVSSLLPEKGLSILSVSPNPVHDRVVITLTALQPCEVVVEVYDLLGRVVARKAGYTVRAGENALVFTADGFANGAYFYRINAREGGSSTEPLTGRFVVAR